MQPDRMSDSTSLHSHSLCSGFIISVIQNFHLISGVAFINCSFDEFLVWRRWKAKGCMHRDGVIVSVPVIGCCAVWCHRICSDEQKAYHCRCGDAIQHNNQSEGTDITGIAWNGSCGDEWLTNTRAYPAYEILKQQGILSLHGNMPV